MERSGFSDAERRSPTSYTRGGLELGELTAIFCISHKPRPCCNRRGVAHAHSTMLSIHLFMQSPTETFKPQHSLTSTGKKCRTLPSNFVPNNGLLPTPLCSNSSTVLPLVFVGSTLNFLSYTRLLHDLTHFPSDSFNFHHPSFAPVILYIPFA